MAKKKGDTKAAQYAPIIETIFFNHYTDDSVEFEFQRTELEEAAEGLSIPLPKNLGDVLYSFRFRTPLPDSIVATAPDEREWVIDLAGRGHYKFRLAKINRVVPNEAAYRIKIPDATPGIIDMYAKTDEQALLAKVRYNRLIDTFLRITAHSLQNHLRTTVPGIGQIEVDELYVGIRNTGQHFIVPVQAKGGNDQIGATQVRQDLELCKHAFPSLTPRLVAVQFTASDVIVMFELTFQDDDLRVVDEKHYTLVASNEITDADLLAMKEMS